MTALPYEIKRVITPSILQMEAAECGAAALGIVMGYFGRHVSLEELRQACGVSRDGSKATNLLRAARNYGFTAYGAKAESEALIDLAVPFIIFWEFNHFVVVEGIGPDKIYINDPATGPRTVSHEEFDTSFTGIVLVFEPGPQFKKGGQKDTLWHSLAPRLQGIQTPLTYIILLSLALVIPGIVIPGFTKIFIDDILIRQVSGWLAPLIWGMVITALLRAGMTWLQQIHLLRLELKLTLTNSARFLWHVLRLPITFFTQRFAGDIGSRVAANDRLASLLSGEISTSFVSLVSMFFYGLIMFLYDWQLTLLAIIVVAINSNLLFRIARGIENSSRRLQQELGRLAGIEMSGLEAIETIKASSGENDFFQRWAGYHAKSLNSQQMIHLYSRTLLIVPQLLTGLLTVAVLGLGGWRIMQGYLSVGSLVAFQSLLISFNEPIQTLLGLGSKLQEIRGDLARLDDVLRHPEDPRLTQQLPPNTLPVKLKGQLELRNLSFGYSPLDPPLFENIYLNLRPGSRIAIAGISGSGKSTLAKLVCGLYTPWSGEILLDDQPLANIPQVTLSHSVSFVDQDICLFEGTIRDNLTLWDQTIPNTALERAIKDAALEPLINARNMGLESKVINAGANFSGGQRQQLEIARALVTEPSLLVLDEATSSLDASTEYQIVQNLKQRNCSLLIIAHRLSTIRDCEEIIVLDHGKIVERGTHDQLCQNNGPYRRLLLKHDVSNE